MLVATVLVSIGLPVLGIGSFHAADVLGSMAPWSQETPYDFRPDNGQVTDTVNGVVPARAAFRERVWRGDLPMWDPLRGPGEPLATVPNVGTFSPLTLPWLVAPLWLAPVLVKLVQVAVAVAGMVLLCRAWGLRRDSAMVGALAFVNSAFLVVWTNWPQANVGALVPLLFWAVERGAAAEQHRRVWPVAAVTAVMWLEGFPSVTAYALLVAGAYAVVRVLVVHGRTRRAATRLLAQGGAVVLGLAVAAIQLLPFLAFLDALDLTGRARVAGVPLPWQQLATTVVPDAFGNPVDRASYGLVNYVEGQSFVGVVVVVLIALLVAGRGRVRPPRGVLRFLAVVGVVGLALVYLDSPLLDLVGRIPLLGTNNIGRFRAVLGVVAACAAALGYEAFMGTDEGFGLRRSAVALAAVALGALPLLLVAGASAADAGRLVYALVQVALPLLVGVLAAAVVLARAGRWEVRPRHVAVAVAVLAALAVGAGLTAVGLGVLGREAADVGQNAIRAFVRSSAFPLGVGVLALAIVAVLMVRQQRGVEGGGARRVAALALPVLLAAEAVAFANPWFARTPRELFFPPTATHDFLHGELGEERFAAADTTLYSSTNGVYGLRSVTSHSFMPPTYRDYLTALEPDAFARSSTFPFLSADAATATSPLLDRAAARFWAVGPTDPLLGASLPGVQGRDRLELRSGDVATSPVPEGLLRGVTLDLRSTDGLVGRPALAVDVLGPDGTVVARGRTRLHWWVEPGPLPVAFPEVEVPSGSRARVSLVDAAAGSIALAGAGDRPALVAAAAVDDGLRLVHTDGAVLYERLDALPRIRWAAAAVVEPDPGRRLDRLAAGLAPEVTVLTSGTATGPGAPAAVDVLRDGGDTIEVRVTAAAAGHLVVADGVQTGWRAELDGRSVPIVAADHAFGAVAVPVGTHHVRLWYHPAGWTEGQVVTLVALLLLAGWAGADLTSRRARDLAAAGRAQRRAGRVSPGS